MTDTVPAPAGVPDRADTLNAVDAIADRFVEDYVAVDPLTATYVGITGHDSELTDLSPDGFEARRDLTREALTAMQAAEATDDRALAAKDAFIERLSVTLDQYAAGTPQSQISVIASGLHIVRGVFDLMPTDTSDAWDNISARLAAIPAALDGYRQTLHDSAAQGHLSAQRQYGAVAAQVRSWTGQDGDAGDFFAQLVEPADVPAPQAGALADAARKASVAFAEFGRFLEQELRPRGREKDAVGRETYAVESRFFLGATVDLEETYQWGWEELYRIESQMAAVADEIRPGASVDEAVAALDGDPERQVGGKDNFRDWMQSLAESTIAELADVHFDIPEPVRRIECRIAPTNDGSIYYTGPSEDFTRPGRMWWAVPAGVDTFSTWREVTTVYHEGVPGHHLQVAQTAYRSELLNRWQRTMCWVSGHGEGWALYAERLMDDLGYLQDPGDKLGMLDGQAMRAARVIIDIGMHLELEIPPDNPFGFHPGAIWNADLGLEFLRGHCRMDDAVIRFEVNRYLGWPGQAPSYKVGERIWLQARDDVRQRKGAAFDLKEFHRQALDLGALGLDPLRVALDRL
jgi:uncharacterized protein (DUF885 family)